MQREVENKIKIGKKNFVFNISLVRKKKKENQQPKKQKSGKIKSGLSVNLEHTLFDKNGVETGETYFFCHPSIYDGAVTRWTNKTALMLRTSKYSH